MATVLLLSATPPDDEDDYNLAPLRVLEQSAAADDLQIHSPTHDPASADVILFAEILGAGFYFERVRTHPLVKEYREKCFLFCANDFVIPFIPGIYASIEKRWSSNRTRPGLYLGEPGAEFLINTPLSDDSRYLYSFVGSIDTAPVRKNLAHLNDPRGFFHDTAADYQRVLHRKMPGEERKEYHRRYAEIAAASKFILCPRGLGTSSMRLFDTMRIGRVPVILSDEWVEPVGPCWDKFSLRVPECEYDKVPAILEEREAAAVEMGLLARAQWEDWFSERVCFRRVVESCLDIKMRRRIPEAWARFVPYIQYLRPFHFRHLLRTKYHAWQQRKRRPGRINQG
jgi:exostosin family protein